MIIARTRVCGSGGRCFLYRHTILRYRPRNLHSGRDMATKRAGAADWPLRRFSLAPPTYVRWDRWRFGTVKPRSGNFRSDFGNSTGPLVAFILRNTIQEIRIRAVDMDDAAVQHHEQTPAPCAPRRPRAELTELLASAAQADEQAWDCLVHRFGATIDRVARRHGLAPAAADDVAQLTWLALLEHIYAVRDAEALGGWIATTARRACLQVQQGATREVLVDEPREVADRTTVEKQVEAAERAGVLRHAMEVLNARERRLVELLLADPEVSYRQIGAALEMPMAPSARPGSAASAACAGCHSSLRWPRRPSAAVPGGTATGPSGARSGGNQGARRS